MNRLINTRKQTKSYLWDHQTNIEIYEQMYEIHDSTKTNNPLSSVAIHPKEINNRNSIFDNRLRKFLDLNIAPKTNISFLDYMNLPRHEIESINRIVDEHNNRNYNMEKGEQEKQERKQREIERNRDRKEALLERRHQKKE